MSGNVATCFDDVYRVIRSLVDGRSKVIYRTSSKRHRGAEYAGAFASRDFATGTDVSAIKILLIVEFLIPRIFAYLKVLHKGDVIARNTSIMAFGNGLEISGEGELTRGLLRNSALESLFIYETSKMRRWNRLKNLFDVCHILVLEQVL